MTRGTAVAGILSAMVIAGGISAPAQGAAQPAAQASMVLSTMVSEGLNILAARALPLLISMAAIGVLAMAIQQAIKDILRLPQGFNERQFASWCRAQGASRDLQNEFVCLAVGSADGTTNQRNGQALFELSISGMTAQMAAAAKFALAFPEQTTDVLKLVVGGLGTGAVSTLVNATRAERQRVSAGLPMTPPHEQLLAQADEARTRLGFLIDRRLDAFQVATTSRWEHVNKVVAFGISAVLAALSITLYVMSYSYWATLGPGGVTVLALIVPLAALVAGFVAPVAKDLVTALQSVRGSR